MNGFPYYVTTLIQLHFTGIFWISLRYMQSLKPGFPSKMVPDTFFPCHPGRDNFHAHVKDSKIKRVICNSVQF